MFKPLEPYPRRPPLPFRMSRARKAGAISSILVLLVYAGLARVMFDTAVLEKSGGVVSLSFVWSMPFAVGALSVAIGRWCGTDGWVRCAAGIPAAVLGLGFVISLVTKVEAAMCVVMAAPIMLLATALGGGLAHLFLPKNRNDYRLQMTLMVFLPYLTAVVEGSLHWPTETKDIEDTIVIHASPELIWQEIASVPAIDPEQISEKWIYWVGFPKPIAATLDREGVGGIRTATFERDVSFFETVTVWDKPARLAFSIHADPDFIPHTAFDQHIIVGGRFYDVLDGTYEIEPLPGGNCRLHLTSRHRLSTRFNSYAGWWSEKVMNQIQGSILEVIRARAEARAGIVSEQQ